MFLNIVSETLDNEGTVVIPSFAVGRTQEILYEINKLKETPFFAQNYIWSQEHQTLVPFTKSHLGEYYGEDVAFESGGCGLVSTLEDYSQLALMLMFKICKNSSDIPITLSVTVDHGLHGIDVRIT